MIEATIPDQNFELIRDRIAQILLVELENQAIRRYDPDLDAIKKVYVERFIPWGHTELPAVNVMLERGDFNFETAIQTTGMYRFLIDVTGSSKTTKDDRGDSLAMIKIQKILGVCRAILDHPKYIRLGFAAPSIERRYVENMYFRTKNEQDATNSVNGRLVFMVKIPEFAVMESQWDIADNQTTIKIGDSEKGYYWEFQQP